MLDAESGIFILCLRNQYQYHLLECTKLIGSYLGGRGRSEDHRVEFGGFIVQIRPCRSACFLARFYIRFLKLLKYLL